MNVNPYQLLRRMAVVRSERLRLLGAWLLSVSGRRYIGIFLDPVLACNLRCRMCYFSDESRRKELHGIIDEAELDTVAERLFPHALKLQIGCGAEPTLFRQLTTVVARAKQHSVPYVSLTTNGQLLTKTLLADLLAAGLDEVTLSLHGLTPTTYEAMMPGASFARFEELVALLAEAKRTHPALVIRLNYTMNSANTDELNLLPDLLRRLPATVVQLRPVQKIGESQWTDFSLTTIKARYDTLLTPLAKTLKAQGVTVLMPTKADLEHLDAPAAPLSEALQELTYLNIEPGRGQQATLPRLSFGDLLRLLLGKKPKEEKSTHSVTKKLAYSVQ